MIEKIHFCTLSFITAHFVHHCTLKQALHSGCFYSASSSPLLIRGAPDYSIDTVYSV